MNTSKSPRTFQKLYQLLILLSSLFSTSLFAGTYLGAGTPVAIPDPGCTTSTVNVTDIGIIGSTAAISSLILNITHTYDGDIDVALISPAATLLDLSSDNGGADDNFINTTFQDGFPSIITGTAPFSGSFQAEGGAFSVAFAGEPISGVWTLQVCDDFGIFSGTLDSWSLSVTDTKTVPTLNEWGLIFLSLMLLLFGFKMKYRNRQ